MRRSSEGVLPAEELYCERAPWDSRLGLEQVIEALEPWVTAERKARLWSVIGARISSVTVVMDAPHDPHNAAAVVRTCEAFGLPEIHIVPRAEKPLMARSVSRGAEHWVDVTIHANPNAAIAALRAQGFTLVATHPSGELTKEDLAKVPRLALLLGNEHDGLREELTRAADHSVRIPMRGFVESLNVSVAAAVLLSAATEQRAGDLALAHKRALYARGLYRSLPRAADLLIARYPEVAARKPA
ncbi:MAG: TrmH family RNA methyltransferase [Myxococcota bacterium]